MDNNIHTKIAYIGGAKSGKSTLAETKILALSKKQKPIYLATAEIIDPEFEEKVRVHRKKRKNNFITIEEPLEIDKVIKDIKAPIIVECLTLWLNNMIYRKKSKKEIMKVLQNVLKQNKTIIFVQNHVGLGITPANKLGREFINMSGEVEAMLSRHCNEMYLCIAQRAIKIK